MVEPLDESLVAYVSAASIAEEYDRYFHGHPLFACDQRFLEEHIVPGSLVLDCGAGTGRHAMQLGRRGCRVVALDLSTHMLGVLQRKLVLHPFFVHPVRCDLRALPLACRKRFDAILLMFSTLGMVHGAATRQSLLGQLAARLAPEGLLILHVHNQNYRYSPHRSPWKRLREKAGQVAGRLEPGDHLVYNYRGVVDLRLHCFTLDELTRLLHCAGLAPVEVVGLNERRDGPCAEEDIDRAANGFLLAAGHAGR